ncbi:Vacuolar assembly/sorting proteins vps39/vam6/vps3 [Globisporangium polare]
MEANAARQRVLHAATSAAAAAPGSTSPATTEGAYDLLEVDVDKPVKKPQQIEALLTSRVAWGDVAPLVFFGTSDSTLHCYVPSTATAAATGAVGQLTYLRWHSSYKKAYHACAQFLDSWGVYLTLYDAKLTLYALPLQSNPQIDGNGNASSSIMKGMGVGGGNTNNDRDKMLVVDETKQTTLFAAHEGAKVVCSLSKQHALRVYDWTVNRTLQLRAQHELPLLLQSFENNSGGSLTSSSLPVQKMIVMGESHLFLQFKKEWCVLNMDSGRIIDVSARDAATAQSVDTVTCAVAVPSRQTGLHHHSHQLRDVFLAGKHSAVVVALTVDNEDEENATILDDRMRSNPQNVSDDRVRVKVERVLEYNVAPRAAFYHHPLLLLDQHDRLAVHNIGSMELLESIPTKALYGASSATSIEKLVSRSNSTTSASQQFAQTANLPASLFTVAAPFSVQLLQMKPIELLVKQAQALGRLEDAVVLCKLCPEDCNLNDDDLRALLAQYAVELFNSGQYRRAMSLFLESKMEVLDMLLALYPRDLLPRSAGGSTGAARLSATAMRAKGARHGELKGDALVQSLLALILLLRHRRDALVNHSTATTTTTSDKKLEIIDTVLLKCLVLICEKEEHAQLAKKELMELVIGKNYCEMGEAEIFLRSHRQLKALLSFYATRKEHRKALELLEDLERTATATLSQSQSSSSPSLAPGEEALQSSEEYMVLIKEYLQRLGQSKAELVFEFSRRVITVKPTLGLSIFTERKVREQKEDIDPSLVLNHLKSCDVQAIAGAVPVGTTSTTSDAEPALAPAKVTLPLIDPRFLAIEYLTQVIFNGKTPIASRLHDEVVYLLLDAINMELHQKNIRSSNNSNTTAGNRLTSRVSSQRGLVGILRKKLIVFLEAESSAYHPERMLSRTPLDMVDERAALLSRLGRHHEVLQLYAIELKDASLAEGYCNRCYDTKLADSSIYSALLRLYLRPLPSQLAGTSGSGPAPPLVWQQRSTSSPSSSSGFLSSEAVTAAVSILNKYPERIDVPTALELLPPDVPVSSLAFFFRRVLERQVERYRNGQVKKQLSKMENFKVREALSTKRKGCVTVWSSHCCQVCGKKLGTGTFVRLPGGALLHYACQPAL